MDTQKGRALDLPPADLLPVLLERLPEVFFRTDAYGRLIWVSANASRMLGYSVEEMIGMEAGGLYARPEERSRIVKDVRAGNGQAVAVEVELRRK
ncbi:MAG: PAS domain-containing protein, partial [Magnetospirillum sp.]